MTTQDTGVWRKRRTPSGYERELLAEYRIDPKAEKFERLRKTFKANRLMPFEAYMAQIERGYFDD